MTSTASTLTVFSYTAKNPIFRYTPTSYARRPPSPQKPLRPPLRQQASPTRAQASRAVGIQRNPLDREGAWVSSSRRASVTPSQRKPHHNRPDHRPDKCRTPSGQPSCAQNEREIGTSRSRKGRRHGGEPIFCPHEPSRTDAVALDQVRWIRLQNQCGEPRRPLQRSRRRTKRMDAKPDTPKKYR